MPVFIQNENELRNEDNSPLPANTPSTGSVYDNSHVVECGNQVLELIQKHKKEVQARMANHEHGFRAMLERSRRIEANHGYREPEKERPAGGSRRHLSENSRIMEQYSTAIEKDIKKTHGIRASIGAIVDVDTTGPGNPIFASSDEYLELPKTGWPEVPTRATNTQATSSPMKNSSPPVEEVNWYEPDQEYVVEGGCKGDDDDDDDDNGNNNEIARIREFATRLRYQFPMTGRGLDNYESNEPSVEPMHPSLHPSAHPSSNTVPSKSSQSAHPSATSVPSKSEQSSKPSSHSPSKSTSKQTKKSAKTTKSQSSHNKNVPDDGNSSSDHEGSVSNSFYSTASTITTVWQDAWGFINNHFWTIVIGAALLILIIAFFLGILSPSGDGSSSGSRSSSTARGGGKKSSTGQVIWHHGPVM